MHQSEEIQNIAHKESFMPDEVILMNEKIRHIPGSVRYSIRRFHRNLQRSIEDTGMILYHFEKENPEENYLELKFCVSGNMYCSQMDTVCSKCRINDSENCVEKKPSIDVMRFRFSPAHLTQFLKPRENNSLSEEILNFSHNTSFSKFIPLCGNIRNVIEGLLNHTYSESIENIYINAQTQMILLYSLDCMLGEKDSDVMNCKFLANEDDRDKIIKARELLILHIGEPITIKELSRKVAINECYLKKGFKEMFGCTIFDFYQSQRMEHARYLLYEKGLSVTDVSVMLGYSSISHFSTAFKKHTGLKPCELLFRP